MITDNEVYNYLEPLLKLNLKEEGNVTTLIKCVRRFINKEVRNIPQSILIQELNLAIEAIEYKPNYICRASDPRTSNKIAGRLRQLVKFIEEGGINNDKPNIVNPGEGITVTVQEGKGQ